MSGWAVFLVIVIVLLIIGAISWIMYVETSGHMLDLSKFPG